MMEENKKNIIYIPVEDILPNRFQPRLAFDEKELNELANSIIKYGVIQPIVVRTLGEKFEIIAGERRYKASVIAGIKKIPSILMETDDNTSAEIALLENLQRKNLTPIEEAKAYKKLIDRGFTQEDIALKIGISQSAVANKIRLLKLPEEVQNALLYNQISERHARSLLAVDNLDLQKSLLKRIIAEKLTVKQTEDEIIALMNAKLIDNTDMASEDIQQLLKPQGSDNIIEKAMINDNEKRDIISDASKNNMEFLDFEVPKVIDIIDEKKEVQTVLPSSEVEFNDDLPLINPFNQKEEEKNTEELSSDESKNIITENREITPDFIDMPSTPFLGENAIPQSISEENPNVEEKIPQKSIKEQLGEINYQTEEPTIIDTNVSEEINRIERIDVDEDLLEEQEKEKEKNSEFMNEYGEIDLPKLINTVRDFASNLGSASTKIDVSEIDLVDKYQITIDISK